MRVGNVSGGGGGGARLIRSAKMSYGFMLRNRDGKDAEGLKRKSVN